MTATQRGRAFALATVGLLASCYTGARASHDINRAWVGQRGSALKAAWGIHLATPGADGEHLRFRLVAERGGTVVVEPTRLPTHIVIGAGCQGQATPGSVQGECAAGISTNGQLGSTTVIDPPSVVLLSEAHVDLDAAGRVRAVSGDSLRWGPPDDANLRAGFIMGFHLGMGRLDTTSTPLPATGLYMGGMLGPRFALVGNFSMTTGSDDPGGAMAFTWGMSAQWWPTMRLSLRGGPAMALVMDPGFDNTRLAPAAVGSAAFALIRSGKFVLDLRAEASATPSSAWGNLGIGVNLQ